MITAILIDSDRKVVEEVSISPSHLAVEEEIMTRFWLATPLPHQNGDVLFHHEREWSDSAPTIRNPSFIIFYMPYIGNALICHRDHCGLLSSAHTPVEQIQQLIKWYELGPWPFPKGKL